MNPYEVLGVGPDAPLEQIETTYRLLLRRWHPDLHQADGAAAVATAEARTRQLNAAMARVRREHHRHSSGHRGDQRRGSTSATDPSEAPADGEARNRGWWDTDYTRWYRGDRSGPASDRPGADRPGGTGSGPASSGSPEAERLWADAPWPDAPVPCPYCGHPFDELDEFNLHLVADHRFRLQAARPRRSRVDRAVDAVGTLRFLPLWLVIPLAFLASILLPFWSWTVVWALVALIMWTQTSRRFKRDGYE